MKIGNRFIFFGKFHAIISAYLEAVDFPEKNIAAANLYNQLGFFNTELDLPMLREQLLEPRVLEMPKDFTIPTLFITASQDQVFPVELIECAAAMVPGATVKVLGDAGRKDKVQGIEGGT